LIKQKRELFENMQNIENGLIECLSYSGLEEKRDEFLKNIDPASGNYLNVIQNLNEDIIEVGTSWLLSIVEKTRSTIMKFLPSFI